MAVTTTLTGHAHRMVICTDAPTLVLVDSLGMRNALAKSHGTAGADTGSVLRGRRAERCECEERNRTESNDKPVHWPLLFL
jgi:hypothetical protein